MMKWLDVFGILLAYSHLGKQWGPFLFCALKINFPLILQSILLAKARWECTEIQVGCGTTFWRSHSF